MPLSILSETLSPPDAEGFSLFRLDCEVVEEAGSKAIKLPVCLKLKVSTPGNLHFVLLPQSVVSLCLCGFEKMVEEGLLPNQELRLTYKSFLTVFFSGFSMGASQRDRRYNSKRFIRELPSNLKNRVKELIGSSDVGKSDSNPASSPLERQIRKKAYSLVGTTPSDEEVTDGLFCALYCTENMSLRSSNQDAAVRLLASLDHKLKKAKKGWEECMPAHSSHGMETLFTPAEIEATDTAYADFMRLLRLSWDYCSQCFEYGAVKVLFPSLNKDAKLNQASTNRFKTLFRRQDSFGGLPPAFLYCLCRGTYNQGKELKLAPIVDLLNQETTFINGDTLPSKAYVLALSSIYAQINDIEREAGRSRTDKKRMCEYNDGVTADMPSDSEDGYDEQNTTGKLEPSFQFFDELDANEENTSVIPASNTAKLCSEKQASSEKILELMENSGFKKEDIAFAKVILVYTLSGKKIPWDRIAGFLPQKWRLAGRKKTCDYWRKTLCPKIQNLID